jgi:hypothetical protein
MLKKLSKWAWWWLTITIVFIVSDIIASKPPHKKPRSWSEYFKKVFPRGWKRILAIGVLTLIVLHLASDVKPITLWEGCK